MNTTRLSAKGQVVIPKPFRDAYDWQPGQELAVIDSGDGILLKAKRPFAPTTLEEVAGCLKYDGAAKSLEEMEAAIEEGIRERYHDSG